MRNVKILLCNLALRLQNEEFIGLDHWVKSSRRYEFLACDDFGTLQIEHPPEGKASA